MIVLIFVFVIVGMKMLISKYGETEAVQMVKESNLEELKPPVKKQNHL